MCKMLLGSWVAQKAGALNKIFVHCHAAACWAAMVPMDGSVHFNAM